MVAIWLHFENKVSFLYIRLRGAESCTVSIKSSIVTLMPSLSVKCVEVIFPVEVKATCFVVVGISLDIVIK